MGTVRSTFLIIIIIQLFYSFAISVFVAGIPAGMTDPIQPYTQSSVNVELSDSLERITDTLQDTTGITLLDLGALAFYSGNILLDFILNFITAIPQMITLLVGSIMTLFGGFSTEMAAYVQTFMTVALFMWYLVVIVEFTTQARTGNIS